MNTKCYAVTGAFGFTGSYIAKRLLSNDAKVITLTNSPNRKSDLQGQIEARPYDFDDQVQLVKSLEGVDTLFNTYWVRFNHGISTHEKAVENTGKLFVAARKAGIKRIVHISIANASTSSKFSYFRCKAQADELLRESGLNYSIIRPAALFGPGGILINNIAWALRRLPVFAIFGNGKYHFQPVYVDDLAALAVECAAHEENQDIAAIGPDCFTYDELIKVIGESIGCKRPAIHLPVAMGYVSAWLIGLIMRDVFATKDELDGLLADLLYAPGQKPTGKTSLRTWLKENKDTLGKSYASELARRRDKSLSYR